MNLPITVTVSVGNTDSYYDGIARQESVLAEIDPTDNRIVLLLPRCRLKSGCIICGGYFVRPKDMLKR